MAKRKNIQRLKDLHIEWFKKRKPDFPAYAIPQPKYSVKNANELTKTVKAWANLNGGRLYRVNTQGQYNEKLGKWVMSGSDKGFPDLAGCTPKGQFLGVEIKFGKDQLSDHQRRVQAQVKDSNGIYIVIRDFDQFVMWWDERFS